MKVFIAGPRKVSKLNKEVKNRLESIRVNGFTVLVGDANGVDKAIQKFYSEALYENVLVYAVNGYARNNLGRWKVNLVKVEGKKKDFSYYAAKDEEMAKSADYGFMIWNGQSKGTLNNMINLTGMNKKVLVYLIPEKKFFSIGSLDECKLLISQKCDEKTGEVFKELLNRVKDCWQPRLNFEYL